jgi:hypothetical protein
VFVFKLHFVLCLVVPVVLVLITKAFSVDMQLIHENPERMQLC